MSSMVLSGDTSGAITLAAPAVSGTNTATLPAATGTVMVSGNMPAFSAYLTANQSISFGNFTKITLNAKNFDTANAFDSTTNYRFQPTIAGYYQINAALGFQSSTSITRGFSSIYKNGNEWVRGTDVSGIIYNSNVATVLYLNGTTDYVELYAYLTATTNIASGGSTVTQMSGVLVRSA